MTSIARDLYTRLVSEAYRSAVKELGATLVEPVDGSTTLVGPESLLDSMALVSVVLDVEQRLAEEANVKVRLMDERALSRGQSPFRTIGTLADYVTELAQPTGP